MRSFVAIALAGAVSARPLYSNDFKFMKFITEHSKSYMTTQEYDHRFDNWKKSDAEINKLNQQNGTAVWGHNFTSDFNREEYEALLGLKGVELPTRHGRYFDVPVGHVSNQSSLNWCSPNGNLATATCNPVKDQGSCGSCWAFATTASMESAHAIFYNTLYSLSEQQLVSCSGSFGNSGCQGGWYYWAWDYATTTPVTTETVYPYTSGTHGVTGKCAYVAGSGVMYDLSQTDVAGNTSAIVAAIT